VDLDHYFTHAEEWERDREKERALEEHGIRVVRVTAKMMDDEPTLARRLRAFFQ
jgi:very-short-patch-repair endonuclease